MMEKSPCNQSLHKGKKMEISDYTLLISSTIIVSGWFVNSLLKRRHEIAKKRMDYRLETLHSFIPVFSSMASSKDPFRDFPSLNDKIKDAHVNFQLYGYENEIRLFDEFVSALKNQDPILATETINKLINIARNGIREELKLPKLPLHNYSNNN